LARFIIAFVRHGEYLQPSGVPSAHLPYPLTPEGEAQAENVAQQLLDIASKEHWQIHPTIDSSYPLRGWQTASIIAKSLEKQGIKNITVECFEELAERGLGSAANLTVDEIERIIETDPRYDPLPVGWKSDSHFRLPLQGAESLMQAGERVMLHVSKRVDCLEKQVSRDTIKIFVGHGAAFRHAAVHMGLLTTEEAVALSMYHCHPLFFEHLNNSKWKHIGGDWKIRQVKGLDLD